jgi:hypothetical protein
LIFFENISKILIVTHQKLLELFSDTLSWKERESDRVKKMINVICTPSLTRRRGWGMFSWIMPWEGPHPFIPSPGRRGE